MKISRSTRQLGCMVTKFRTKYSPDVRKLRGNVPESRIRHYKYDSFGRVDDRLFKYLYFVEPLMHSNGDDCIKFDY